MLNHLVTQALPLLGATVMPAYRYLGEAQYATLEYYNAARARTKSAEVVLNLLAAVTCSVALTKGIDREELFERYDIKLWSFNDHVALFALATIPSIAVLAALYVTFRSIEKVHSALSL